MLSAYRSKIERALETERAENKGGTRFIHKTIRDGKRYCEEQGLIEDEHSEDLTFGEFLSYVESIPPVAMNEHWQPQWLISGLGCLHYEFVGRFERLEEDAEALCRKVGFSELYTEEVESVPKTASSCRDVLTEYYTRKCSEQVARIYRKDIELLNYEAP